MDLVVKALRNKNISENLRFKASVHLDLLLTCSGEEEVVHLSLQCVVDLDIDVVAGSLLRLGLSQLLHGDHVVDHDRVRWVQQWVQPLRDLRKLHPVRLNKTSFTRALLIYQISSYLSHIDLGDEIKALGPHRLS